MPEDADHRLAQIIVDLVRLGRLLPPDDFADLVGAVSVEVETGLELVAERALRRWDGNVVTFPDRTLPGHVLRTPVG
ncbi:hypothetical protein [Methylobacterium pseudosasicola]|uniref:Uncharacterized protein n=1 Tax=Methylobacterium pseudosasicola TaxID=582667 RepID=A0A1I4PTS1_9HYPH|nr:hypothetical protein [Methylobacterium pseudosasicola]SFM31168.1 hypothetical protein SAMN05192568_102660 [Methylobacterium pseudosasicola]